MAGITTFGLETVLGFNWAQCGLSLPFPNSHEPTWPNLAQLRVDDFMFDSLLGFINV